jgi:type I restriction enzyme S subunit
VIYIDEDFWPLNTTLWVKEFKKATPTFAYYLLSGLELAQFNAGVAVPTLNRNDIHGLQVVLPPRNVLETFENHITAIFKFKKTLEAKNQNFRQTRDLLLPKLISGEVAV